MTASTAGQADISPESLDAIASFATAELANGTAVGGVLGVASAEGVMATIPVGSIDLDGSVPMPPDAIMPIASVSKTFLALLALQEREAGRLDLHAPLSEYLPWFEPETIGGPMTVHSCLTHTTGLPWGRSFCGEAVHSLAVTARDDGPFTVGPVAYSNDGMDLVGLAVERVTGRRIVALLEERILKPLGMTSSRAALTSARRLDCVPGYVSAYDDRPAQWSHPAVPGLWVVMNSPAGSMSCSSDDLCALPRLLLGDGEGEAGTVISQESCMLLRTPHVHVPSGMLATMSADTWLGYGTFGGVVDGAEVLWSPGRLKGYSALVMTDRDLGLGVTWQANGESSQERIARYALQALRAERRGSAPPEPPATEKPARTAAPSDRFLPVRDRPETDSGLPRDVDSVSLELGPSDQWLLAASRRLPLSSSSFVADGFLVDAPRWDRYVLRLECDAGGNVTSILHGPRRWVREDLPRDAAPDLPSSAEACIGTYRCQNPFWPVVCVFARRGGLWALLDDWGTEMPLEPLGDDRYRVGPPPSGSRMTFDTPVEGQMTRLVLDHESYYRSSLE